jgi:hypothetical protein
MARWSLRVRLDGAGRLLFSAGVFLPRRGMWLAPGEPGGRAGRKGLYPITEVRSQLVRPLPL